MPGATPKYGIPYPLPGEPVTDYPDVAVAAETRWEAIWSTRTRIADVFTAAAGWSLQNADMDVMGPLGFLYVTATRTGAAVTVPPDGNITTNLVVASFDNTRFSYLTYGPLGTWSSGRLAAWYLSGSSLTLGAVAPGASIATGEVFSVRGVGLLVPGNQIIP